MAKDSTLAFRLEQSEKDKLLREAEARNITLTELMNERIERGAEMEGKDFPNIGEVLHLLKQYPDSRPAANFYESAIVLIEKDYHKLSPEIQNVLGEVINKMSVLIADHLQSKLIDLYAQINN